MGTPLPLPRLPVCAGTSNKQTPTNLFSNNLEIPLLKNNNYKPPSHTQQPPPFPLPYTPTTPLFPPRYVEQTDTHTPQLTVQESLVFSARLRLPMELPVGVVLQHAQQVGGGRGVRGRGGCWVWRGC